MNQKKVYILRGPSGSGKTTWTEKLAGDIGNADKQVTVCSADHFFESQIHAYQGDDDKGTPIGVPSYDFDASKLPEAHQRCMQAFLMAVMESHSVIVVDNTNEHRWEYVNYELMAELAGYDVEIIEFVADTVENIRTCATRTRHNVPLAVIAKKAVSMEPDTRATRILISGI